MYVCIAVVAGRRAGRGAGGRLQADASRCPYYIYIYIHI